MEDSIVPWHENGSSGLGNFNGFDDLEGTFCFFNILSIQLMFGS